MNINEILERVFKDFQFEGEKIPISPYSYDGEASTYLVYYTYLDQPEGFANDLPIVEGTYGTIDIFTKKDFKELKNIVKRKIVKECGFTWLQDGLEDFEEDTKLYHIPIDFFVESSVTFLD